MKLTPDNCPGVNDERREAINVLSTEELTLEIEKGSASRFGAKMQPVLRTALQLRKKEVQLKERDEELEVSREANRIAEKALKEAEKANQISKESKFWSAVAVLISTVTALIIYFTN